MSPHPVGHKARLDTIDSEGRVLCGAQDGSELFDERLQALVEESQSTPTTRLSIWNEASMKAAVDVSARKSCSGTPQLIRKSCSGTPPRATPARRSKIGSSEATLEYESSRCRGSMNPLDAEPSASRKSAVGILETVANRAGTESPVQTWIEGSESGGKRPPSEILRFSEARFDAAMQAMTLDHRASELVRRESNKLRRSQGVFTTRAPRCLADDSQMRGEAHADGLIGGEAVPFAPRAGDGGGS